MRLLTALLGFIGGLLTPWVRWKIDEQKLARKEKSEHIKNWRLKIEGFDFTNQVLGDTDWYSSLRTHMSDEIVAKVEAPRTFYVGGGRGDNVIKHMLLDEVSRLEQDLWRSR